MPSFTEQTLDGWRKPASETEEQKISNAISMIKDAIKAHDNLKDLTIEFIIQGSYGNNTNVKIDSDIDVCVMLTDTVFCAYREGASDKDYGYTTGTTNYSDYRSWVISAIVTKFGAENVITGNKSIKIKSNSFHVHADVVPAFQFRNYKYEKNNNPKDYYEGIKFYSSDNTEVINYPKRHISNGILKNDQTLRRYKRTVRLYKRIKNKMIEDGIPVSSNIRSFLIECMLWNIPNQIFTNSKTWNDVLRESIISLYNSTKTEEGCKSWLECSELIYLFHSLRKWNRADTNSFLLQMWQYLEYR